MSEKNDGSFDYAFKERVNSSSKSVKGPAIRGAIMIPLIHGGGTPTIEVSEAPGKPIEQIDYGSYQPQERPMSSGESYFVRAGIAASGYLINPSGDLRTGVKETRGPRYK